MTIRVCSLLKSPMLVTAASPDANSNEPAGRGLTAEQIIPELVSALTTLLGPFKNQRFVTVPSKMTNTVLAGKINMGMKLYKLMHNLDFTPTRSDITGAYGGFRQELDGKVTTVNYCSRSGVLVVTTNIT